MAQRGHCCPPVRPPFTTYAVYLCVFTYFLIRSPIDPKILLVKRIVALEGDIVKTLPPYPDTEVTIPPGHVWLEGMNIFTFS
jgi:signal peptidase I